MLVECPEFIASARVGVVDFLTTIIPDLVECKFIRTVDIQKKDIEWSDIYISVRGCERLSYELVKYAKKNGRRIIYYLDDDLRNVPKDSTAYGFYSCKDTLKYMSKILEMSEDLWGVNELIKDHYLEQNQKWIGNKIPCYIEKRQKEDRKNIISIVYAGSVSHQGLVDEILQPAIEIILEKYKGKIKFTFIGPKLRLESDYVENIKLMDDYDQYLRYMRQHTFDYGLAVVGTDSFYWHKYYNKYLEYAKWGIVGIYTNSKPYTYVVENGKNGILVDNENWVQALENIIISDDLRELRNEIREDISENFSEDSIRAEFLSNYGDVFVFETARTVRGVFPCKTILWLTSRFPLYWDLFGWSMVYVAPIKMVKKVIRKSKK